jgi:hypothetical protein
MLRYTEFISTIFATIKTGLLGNIVNITHRENISGYHMVHSFIRGSWANVAKSSPMILAKCCHDLDLIYTMARSLPKKISSFGNLSHFNSKNASKGALKYCLDGCPVQKICLYYAPRTYVDIIPIVKMMLKGKNKIIKFIGNLRRNHVKIITLLSKPIPPFKKLRYWQE